ncbi:proteasome subunit beta type-7-A-like isoform X2 [Apium graveolens]|uniref:proteasome subunit beta type-7-A-like isoform X2 n=1 Tax=Apium graveolens TaxID=4045 RepID=UPI003D7A1C72
MNIRVRHFQVTYMWHCSFIYLFEVYNISSQLKLHHYHTGRESRVVRALTLLKTHICSYQGHVSAALVLDGVDVTGPHLHIIYPHGSTDSLPFVIMGSGSLAAMAVFESRYAEGINRDDGVALVRDDIRCGSFELIRTRRWIKSEMEWY